MVALSKSSEVMSVAEFLSWTPPDSGLWQLVDGVPCAMVPANRSHGAIQGELARLPANHLAVTCSRYEVEEATLSEPILPVEILSPSNQVETWINVWSYTTIPSAREILVLRSRSIAAYLLRRRADGSWPDQADTVEAGDLALESIDFRALLGSIYRTTRLDAR